MIQNLRETLQNLGLNVLDFGNCFRCKPPYRASNNNTSLAIFKQDGRFYDFSEKIGGSFNDLLKLLKKEISYEETQEQFIEKPIIKTQKIYDRILLHKLVKNYDYWLQKGISLETIQKFEGGIAENGPMKNRWTFPIFNSQNQLVGSSGRWLGELNDFIPKWKHLFKVSEALYPIHLNKKSIIEKKEIILIESIGNAVALAEKNINNYLVLFGTKINRILISFLLKHNIQKIILILDNDVENNRVGNNAAEDIKSKLLHYFDENQIVNLTELVQNNDLCNWFEKDGYGFEQFCKENKL